MISIEILCCERLSHFCVDVTHSSNLIIQLTNVFNALFLSLFISTYFILLPFFSCTHGTFYSPAEFQVETYVPENCVYFENYKVNMNLFIIISPFVTTQPNIVLPFNSSIQNFESTSNNLLLQFSLGHCCKTLCSIFGFINTQREREERI